MHESHVSHLDSSGVCRYHVTLSDIMGTRVYIGGLPYRVKERDIERFFRGYGKLREVLIKNGYGFVVINFQYCQVYLYSCFFL